MTEDFDPQYHPDPVVALTLRLRTLPVGRALRLPDGTTVKSVPMRHGANYVRRFAVVRKGARPVRLGSRDNSAATAQVAAQQALGGKK